MFIDSIKDRYKLSFQDIEQLSIIDRDLKMWDKGSVEDLWDDIIKKRIGNNTLGFNQLKRGKEENDSILEIVEPDDLVSYGLIPELIGRLHSIATLKEISKESMVKILTEPKNSIVRQYKKLFTIDDVQLSFEESALEAIAELALKRKTGARGLRTILEEVMLDVMYELPELGGFEVLITKEVVTKKAKPIYKKLIKKSA